jgi:predicted acyltransferase
MPSPAGGAEPQQSASSHLSLEQPEPQRKPRLQSLDALRGLTILLMLLVNNIALDQATPPQLVHAPWNGGVHLADLVFPWFLLCMGMAVPFSDEGMISRGMSGWARLGRIFIRTLILFFFGCLIVSAEQGTPTLSLDVLQLLALAYFFGSLLYPAKWQVRAAIAGVLLAAYGLALTMIPLPPHGQPVFLETHNLVRHVNMHYLARFNMAGLLSVVPTTALVLIGSLLTNALRATGRSDTWKLLTLSCVGAALISAGSVWNEVLPFNKTVWTPSYILLSAGLGAILLAGLYWVMDIKKWKGWAYPLLVFGSNALAAYVFPVLIKVLVLQREKVFFHGERYRMSDAWLHAFIDPLGRYWGGWAYTLSYMLAVWLVLWCLYWRKWFLRV